MSQEPKAKLTIFQKIDKIGDLCFINLLFVMSCIPIITIGAAITAMYSFTTKMVNDEEGPVWKGYWKAFKDNFKQATKAWVVVLLFLVLLYVEFAVMMSVTGFIQTFVMGIMALEAIFLSFTLPLLFPLIARYENTTKNMFKNAFLISISNLGSWFYLFFIWIIPVAVYALNLKIFYYTWVLWLVFLVGLFAYASSFVIVKLYEKLESKEAAKDSENTEKNGAVTKTEEDSVIKAGTRHERRPETENRTGNNKAKRNIQDILNDSSRIANDNGEAAEDEAEKGSNDKTAESEAEK